MTTCQPDNTRVRVRAQTEIPARTFYLEIVRDAHGGTARCPAQGGPDFRPPAPHLGLVMDNDPPAPTCDGEAHEWTIVLGRRMVGP